MSDINTKYGIKLLDEIKFDKLIDFGFTVFDSATIIGHYAIKEFEYEEVKETIRIEKKIE